MESPLGLLWRETLESIPLKEHFSFDPLERLARHTAIEAQRGLQPDNYVESIIPIMESAAEFFFKVSPIFKHDAFREESEFRIFCTELDHRSLEVDFRRDKLVRYTELRFEDAIPDIVRHVLLGPCEPLHEGALIDSVKIALDKAKIEEVSVLPSGIPLKTSS